MEYSFREFVGKQLPHLDGEQAENMCLIESE